MNRIVNSLTAITGLLGLALTTRADIPNSLPIGIALIVMSGVLFFVAIKIREENAKSERAILFEKLSLKDIKNSLDLTINNMGEMNNNSIILRTQLLEQMSENHNAILQTNELLKQVSVTIQAEVKMLMEQQEKSSEAAFSTIINVFNSFDKSQSKIADELVKLNETVTTYDCKSLEQMGEICNIIEQTNVYIEHVPIMLQTELKTLIEQQQNLSEIMLDDVREILNEFSDNQSRSADDIADSIKRTMKATNNALSDLPLTLEKFSSQNAETIKKSVDGYKQFEILMNTTLEQMTSISNQDYDLLKEMIK